jgi:CRISPR/Cas system-associated exonuclease Cas4 (RecB family)
MVAGKEVLDASPRAYLWYKGFTQAIKKYTILSQEEEQTVPLIPGVDLIRIIDVMALDEEGEPVIVDFKGSVRGWDPILGETGITSYKAQGFQTAAYLLPAAKKFMPKQWKAWPTRIDYLVTDGTSGRTFSCAYREQDIENLKQAARVVAGAKEFPLHQGVHCRYCPYMEMCYEAKGWKKLYKRRK